MRLPSTFLPAFGTISDAFAYAACIEKNKCISLEAGWQFPDHSFTVCNIFHTRRTVTDTFAATVFYSQHKS